MFDYQGTNPRQFMTPEPFGHSQINRVQPILCDLVTVFEVNMRRFAPSWLKKKNRNPFKNKMVGIGLV